MNTALVKVSTYEIYNLDLNYLDSVSAPSESEAQIKFGVPFEQIGMTLEVESLGLRSYEVKSICRIPCLVNSEYNRHARVEHYLIAQLRDDQTLRIQISNYEADTLEAYGVHGAPEGSILSRILRPFGVSVGMSFYDC